MYEVEVKVPAELAAVQDRLQAVGAERLRELEQVDTYYDAPDRDFAETDEALRTREERPLDGTEGAVDKVTYKGPKLDDDSKTREEHETTVADREALAGILAGLGYEPVATVRKERVFYAYEGFTVTLDRVDGLGEFVEVERDVEPATDAEPATDVAADIEAVRERALAVLRDLGFDPDDGIRTSYLGLLLDGEE